MLLINIQSLIMSRFEQAPLTLKINAARDFFDPKNFGFEKHGGGWKKALPEVGAIIFTSLGWEHVHLLTSLKDANSGNALELASQQQETVFGMEDPRDVMPPNLLSTMAKTGGSAFVAYTEKEGFTDAGWVGFGFVFGGNSVASESIFLGVRKEYRSQNSIGFYLRLLQSYTALENGYTRIEWTQCPLRGEIAKLGIGKLGGTVSRLTIDKYLGTNYTLYGPGSTDRITVEWDLLSPRTHQKITDISQGVYRGLTLEDVRGVPVVTESNVHPFDECRDSTVLYEIPANADELDGESRITWRAELRKVFGLLMDTERVEVSGDAGNDPALVQKITTSGAYQIVDFATGFEGGVRRNFYVLNRKVMPS